MLSTVTRRHSFGAVSRGGRAGFGATDTTLVEQQVTNTLSALERERQTLVALGVRLMRVGETLPRDAVEGFYRRRRDMAVTIQRFIDGVNEKLGTSYPNYGYMMLDQIKLLPREVIPADLVSSSTPTLTRTEQGFGEITTLTIALVGIIAVGGVALAYQFNSDSRAIEAQSNSNIEWAESQIRLLDAAKDAGLQGDALRDFVESNGKPPPPPPGGNLVDTVKWVAGGLALVLGLKIVSDAFAARKAA